MTGENCAFGVRAQNNICPLHVASKWGKLAMVQLLLEHKALVDCVTKDGLTPLHCASRSGQNQVLELLLASGANYSAPTRVRLLLLLLYSLCSSPLLLMYSTVFLGLCSCDHEYMHSLEHYPLPSRSQNGLTPLHMAAQGAPMPMSCPVLSCPVIGARLLCALQQLQCLCLLVLHLRCLLHSAFDLI